MNYDASSKVQIYKSRRSSMNEYDAGENFQGFSKLATEARPKEIKQKVTISSILCRNKVKSVTKDNT